MHPLAAIPSPTHAVWHLGPIPIRAYALCIVAGIFIALYSTMHRWRARGGKDEDIWDVAGWAVGFGIIGGRLYHVVTDPELYFDKGQHPINAFKIWDGGLGIWGAIALGTLGAWIGCRRHGLRLTAFADAAVPGVAVAQALGRWGNWFNNELYGGPTNLPWKLAIHDIDPTHGVAQACTFGNIGQSVCGYYQPTFLYESLWDLALAGGLILAARRWKLGRGNQFALYAMGYTVGRAWIEALRHDHANHFLGLRLNDWTSLIVFLGGLAWFLRHRNQFDESVYTKPAVTGSAPVDLVKKDEPAVDEVLEPDATADPEADPEADPAEPESQSGAEPQKSVAAGGDAESG